MLPSIDSFFNGYSVPNIPSPDQIFTGIGNALSVIPSPEQILNSLAQVPNALNPINLAQGVANIAQTLTSQAGKSIQNVLGSGGVGGVISGTIKDVVSAGPVQLSSAVKQNVIEPISSNPLLSGSALFGGVGVAGVGIAIAIVAVIVLTRM